MQTGQLNSSGGSTLVRAIPFAIRIDTTDDKLDGDLVARALAALIEKEKPDAVVMGKQAVDGDS